MENTKFVIVKNGQEKTIGNDWLKYCTLKNIPMIRVYPKTKYSSIVWDFTSIEKEKAILNKNCKEIEEFFTNLGKTYSKNIF